MFRAHVLIIRRSKLHYIASGIITSIGVMIPVHETATYRCDDTRGCVMQFWPPGDEHMCSKHVEAWNKLIQKNFIIIFFFENRAVSEIIWKTFLEPGSPQMRIWCALHAAYQGYKHALRIYMYLYFCISTATMAPRKLLDVKLYAHCRQCFFT